MLVLIHNGCRIEYGMTMLLKFTFSIIVSLKVWPDLDYFEIERSGMIAI